MAYILYPRLLSLEGFAHYRWGLPTVTKKQWSCSKEKFPNHTRRWNILVRSRSVGRKELIRTKIDTIWEQYESLICPSSIELHVWLQNHNRFNVSKGHQARMKLSLMIQQDAKRIRISAESDNELKIHFRDRNTEKSRNNDPCPLTLCLLLIKWLWTCIVFSFHHLRNWKYMSNPWIVVSFGRTWLRR